MFTILLDEQMTGDIGHLRATIESDDWKSLAQLLGIHVTNFPEIGLSCGTSDRDVWQFCQKERYYLLTDNRNRRGADSLEETIRQFNTPTSLPIFTISDRERLGKNRDYAERVIKSLFEKLIDADNLIGTGRLYLP